MIDAKHTIKAYCINAFKERNLFYDIRNLQKDKLARGDKFTVELARNEKR